jgi:hypothetical protein
MQGGYRSDRPTVPECPEDRRLRPLLEEDDNTSDQVLSTYAVDMCGEPGAFARHQLSQAAP